MEYFSLKLFLTKEKNKKEIYSKNQNLSCRVEKKKTKAHINNVIIDLHFPTKYCIKSDQTISQSFFFRKLLPFQHDSLELGTGALEVQTMRRTKTITIVQSCSDNKKPKKDRKTRQLLCGDREINCKIAAAASFQ